MSRLTDFLEKTYTSNYGVVRPDIETRVEYTQKHKFEIRDNCPSIMQEPGKGVAVFTNNTGYEVEIVDFEAFINSLAGTEAGEGLKCDFLIDFKDLTDLFLFAELTETKEIYLKPHLNDGVMEEGKFAHAESQLKESIEKIMKADAGFLAQYRNKTALFAFRLPEIKQKNPVASSVEKFRKPLQLNLIKHWENGFKYERRMYNAPYELR